MGMMNRFFSLLPLLGSALLITLLAQETIGSGTPRPSPDEAAPQSPFSRCLPAGIRLANIVEVTSVGSAKGQSGGPHKVTVEQKLNALNATCDGNNKLLDGNGKQIV